MTLVLLLTGAGGGTSPIAGTSAGSATATGAIRARGPVAGAASAAGSATGAIRARAGLSGAASGAGTEVAAIRGRGLLSGSAAGAATATGTGTASLPFVVFACGSSAADLYDAVQAIMGYPASGNHTGGGSHVTIPGSPPGPGWTERHCYAIHDTVSGIWAHPMDDAVVARINDPVALGQLPAPQQALLLAARDGATHLPNWNPEVNEDCVWEDP